MDKDRIKKMLRPAGGVLVGAFAGFLFYHFIGCNTGG